MTSKLAFWRRKASVLPLLLSSLGLGCAGAYASDFNVAHGQLMTGSHVPMAVATGLAPRLGVLPAEKRLQLSLNLPVRNQDQLDDFLAQLQDPNSPNFHKYLSVAEYTDRFGPSQADYDEVVSWAQANGFTVTETAPNRRLVNVEAPVSVINKAMHVTMSQFAHPTENRTFFAADREPQVNIGVQLLHVTGLDNFQRPFNHLKARGGDHNSAPVAHAGGSGPSGEFLPSDMRAAYYGSGSLTGAGQTIGIFSFDGYKASDLTVYKNGTGMTFSTPVNNVLVNGYSGVCDDGTGSGTGTCDDGEQILDIVNAIGMAPGITQVLFYEGSSATPILNKMVSDNSAKVLSSSWGGGGFNNTTDDPIYQEMAAQGQTFLNATGDEGAYNSSTWLAPSADPNVLEVGGTDLTTASAGGAWASETGWPDSGGGFYSGSGSHTPSYQQLAGVITTTNKGSTTYRNDPDVAMEANFDNPTASNGQFLTGYGGTSFAAPRWAGFIALVNQQSVANGHGTVGFVNPAIYNVGISSSYSSDFHDITSGNNKPTAGSGTGFNAVAGFDLVTGWGSPERRGADHGAGRWFDGHGGFLAGGIAVEPDRRAGQQRIELGHGDRHERLQQQRDVLRVRSADGRDGFVQSGQLDIGHDGDLRRQLDRHDRRESGDDHRYVRFADAHDDDHAHGFSDGHGRLLAVRCAVDTVDHAGCGGRYEHDHGEQAQWLQQQRESGGVGLAERRDRFVQSDQHDLDQHADVDRERHRLDRHGDRDGHRHVGFAVAQHDDQPDGECERRRFVATVRQHRLRIDRLVDREQRRHLQHGLFG